MNFNATFIGQMISFVVFVWVCTKYIWPPVIQAMRERQKSIADGLAAAERAEKDLALAQNRAGDQLREAKEEAARIIEQARGRAAQMVEEAKATAREEGERQLEAARAQIEQEANRVREQLRGQVADLAVAGAERILRSSIDRKAHGALLEQLAGEL